MTEPSKDDPLDIPEPEVTVEDLLAKLDRLREKRTGKKADEEKAQPTLPEIPEERRWWDK